MVARDDWRRMNQEDDLMGISMRYVSFYTPYSEEWDHEHCSFCFAAISAHERDLHDGYCSLDPRQTHWVCRTCFSDFKAEFKWVVINPQGCPPAPEPYDEQAAKEDPPCPLSRSAT